MKNDSCKSILPILCPSWMMKLNIRNQNLSPFLLYLFVLSPATACTYVRMYLQCKTDEYKSTRRTEERIEKNTVLLYLIRFLSIYFMHKVNSLVCLPMYLPPISSHHNHSPLPPYHLVLRNSRYMQEIFWRFF